MAKVQITTAGHTVEIEDDMSALDLAVLALMLWRDTRDPKLDRAWSAGFATTERACDQG